MGRKEHAFYSVDDAHTILSKSNQNSQIREFFFFGARGLHMRRRPSTTNLHPKTPHRVLFGMQRPLLIPREMGQAEALILKYVYGGHSHSFPNVKPHLKYFLETEIW
jgi:hypothetical protein